VGFGVWLCGVWCVCVWFLCVCGVCACASKFLFLLYIEIWFYCIYMIHSILSHDMCFNYIIHESILSIAYSVIYTHTLLTVFTWYRHTHVRVRACALHTVFTWYTHARALRTLFTWYVRCSSDESQLKGWKVRLGQWRWRGGGFCFYMSSR